MTVFYWAFISRRNISIILWWRNLTCLSHAGCAWHVYYDCLHWLKILRFLQTLSKILIYLNGIFFTIAQIENWLVGTLFSTELVVFALWFLNLWIFSCTYKVLLHRANCLAALVVACMINLYLRFSWLPGQIFLMRFLGLGIEGKKSLRRVFFSFWLWKKNTNNLKLL